MQTDTAVVEEAVLLRTEAVPPAETRSGDRRREEDRALIQRVAVLEQQLALAITERSRSDGEVRTALQAERVVAAEMRDDLDSLRGLVAQMAGLLKMVSDVCADQVGPDVAGVLFVAGAAAKEILGAV